MKSAGRENNEIRYHSISPIVEGLFTLGDVLEDKQNGFAEVEVQALIEEPGRK